MKLAKVAISVAVVIGAVATGGSWYTGKQIEQRYGELVQKANQSLQQLKIYGVQAELKDVQIERGLFSSAARYNLAVKSGDESYEFKGNDTLYHGPLPLNRLMKGNIVPVMASAESNISVPENLKAFFTKSELLQGKTDISYSENFSGEVNVSSFRNESRLEVSDSTFKYDLEQSGKGKVKFAIPLFKFNDAESGINVVVEQTEYDVDLKGKSEYQFITLGDFEGKVKSYAFSSVKSDSGAPKVSFNDIKMKGDGKIVNGIYQSYADFTVKNVVLENQTDKQDFGKLKMDIFVGLDAKMYDQFMNDFGSPEKLQSGEVDQNFKALLTKGVQFHLKELALENSKGKNELALVVNSDPFEFEQIRDFNQVLKLFKQSKLSGKFDLAAMEETAKQFNSLNPATKAEADKIAKNFMTDLVAQAQGSDLVELDAEKLKFNLEIDQGKVKLNGNDVPEEQVQGMLFMIMLGLGTM